MPRRKVVDADLPDEEKKPFKKKVEAEHVVKYKDVVTVPASEDELPGDEFFFDDSAEQKQKRKTKNEREDLRKELALNNITPGSNLKISIERYRHSETATGGVWAETENCTIYACDKAHITSEAYIDVARKYGPGRYRFTLRLNNKIVTAWDKWINMPNVNGQATTFSDPNNPQVVYQMPGGMIPNGAPPMNFQDYLKQMVQTTKLLDELRGGVEANKTEDDALAGAILKRPEVLDTVIGSVMSKYKNGGEGDIAWSSVAMEAVRNGQAASVVQTAGNVLMSIIRMVLPPTWGNNGQQTQPPPPNAPRNVPMDAQAGQQATQIAPVSMGAINTQPNTTDQQRAEQSPEDQILNHLLNFALDQCAKQRPVEVVYDSIVAHVDDEVPSLYRDGVWTQLDQFAATDIGVILAWVDNLPNGKAITSLPHTKEWTAKLQEMIKTNQAETEAEA